MFFVSACGLLPAVKGHVSIIQVRSVSIFLVGIFFLKPEQKAGGGVTSQTDSLRHPTLMKLLISQTLICMSGCDSPLTRELCTPSTTLGSLRCSSIPSDYRTTPLLITNIV